MIRRRIERSLREPEWVIRFVTLLILLAGGAVVVFTYSRSESRRARDVEPLAIGDSASRVVTLLGEPAAVCRTGSLAHLRGQFSPEWSVAAADRALERLRQQTAERWLYPLEGDDASGCGPLRRGTEIGVDANRTVLWLVPLIGKRPLVLPASYTPATVNTDTLRDDA